MDGLQSKRVFNHIAWKTFITEMQTVNPRDAAWSSEASEVARKKIAKGTVSKSL